LAEKRPIEVHFLMEKACALFMEIEVGDKGGLVDCIWRSLI
jgi:hypothetical protein